MENDFVIKPRRWASEKWSLRLARRGRTGMPSGSLARFAATSLREIRKITTALPVNEGFERRAACASCRRIVPAIMYLTKCAHCSHVVRPGDDAVRAGGDMLHAACFRILASDENIRLSRKLNAESRSLIDKPRRQLREQRGR